MITLDNCYERFYHNCSITISTLEEELLVYNQNRDYLISKLEEQDLFFKSLNFDYKKFFNSSVAVKGLNLILIKDAHILTTLYVLLDINRVILKLNLKLKFYKTQIVSIKLYKAVINKFNLKIREKMLTLGYALGVRYIGTFKVKTKENKQEVKRINWGESNKLKKLIIEQGQIPFESITNEKGEIIGNNGGVKWLVYISNRFDTWWYWNKKVFGFENSDFYKFKPAKHARLALREILNNDKTAYLKYYESISYKLPNSFT